MQRLAIPLGRFGADLLVQVSRWSESRVGRARRVFALTHVIYPPAAGKVRDREDAHLWHHPRRARQRRLTTTSGLRRHLHRLLPTT